MSVDASQQNGRIQHLAVRNVEGAAAVACAAVREGAVSVSIAEDWRPSGATWVRIGWPEDREKTASEPRDG